MTKEQNQYYLMIKAVLATSAAHPTATAGIPAYNTALLKLIGAHDLIEPYVAAQSAVSAGETEAKNTLRRTLEGKVMRIADTLVVHAGLTNNSKLKKSASITITSLRRMSDPEMASEALRIITLAEDESPAALTALGLPAADVASASSDRADFSSMLGETKHIISEAAGATKLLEQAFATARQVLDDELDPVARLLQYTQPAFYLEYTHSRTITDPGYNTRSLTVNIRTKGTGAPVEGAEATITPGDIPKVSGKKGIFVINQLGAAEYSMLITDKDHQAKTVQFTIANNQHTIVDVELLPKDVTDPS